MDGEHGHDDELAGDRSVSSHDIEDKPLEKGQTPAQGAGQRIQFIPPTKPDRGRPVTEKEDGTSFAGPAKRRSLSVASIPQVISEKDKDIRRSEREHERKHVNIDEHLIPHEDVAKRYMTMINMKKPDDSFGLTAQKADQLLQEHGLNILTPPKRRHPFLKYLDYLTSLFNLLLIIAGVLEYILLGINFKNNFQNVSSTSSLSLTTAYNC